MTPALRFAGREDVALLARIQAEAWRDSFRGLLADAYLDGPAMPGDLLRLWEEVAPTLTRPRPVIAVDRAGLPIGFCAGGRPRGLNTPLAEAEVYAVYVARAQRRRGVGATMLGEYAALARKYGARDLVIWALEGNLPACAFYAGLGGAIIAREAHPIGGVVLPEAAFVWRDLAALERDCFARAARESFDVRA